MRFAPKSCLITVFVTVLATANDELKRFIAKLDDIEKAKWQVINMSKKADQLLDQCCSSEYAIGKKLIPNHCSDAHDNAEDLAKQAWRTVREQYRKTVEDNKSVAISMLAKECAAHLDVFEKIKGYDTMEPIAMSESLAREIRQCCLVSAELKKMELTKMQATILHQFRNRMVKNRAAGRLLVNF